jgi:transcriptional antiterminator NusG
VNDESHKPWDESSEPGAETARPSGEGLGDGPLPQAAVHEETPPTPPVEEAGHANEHTAESSDRASTNGAASAEDSSDEDADEVGAAEAGGGAPKSQSMDWYILKVQSNREDSIRDGLLRRVKIAGLEYFFDEVVVPTETVSEYKDGKRRTRKQKIWPGYIVIHMEINEETWFLVRETPGIGDFTGSGGKPTPMKPAEVEKILRLIHPEKHAAKEKTPVKIAFQIGDRVKIKEGTFQNFDGEVGAIDHTNGRVTVMTEIFNRKTPVELDYWQVERI